MNVNEVYYPKHIREADVYNLLQLYDAGRVQRFHTTPDYSGAPRQSLAEHQWGVAMLCRELCRRTGVPCSVELLTAALTHDLSEYWTCDIPAHVSWEHPALKESLQNAQTSAEVAHGIWSEQRLSADEKRVLKWADGLELYVYSRQRARAGVTAYDVVATNIARHLVEKEQLSDIDNRGRNLLYQLIEALA
jgi:5'-deoxynucleotidase YfbR-like HD superfamily hydrolase